MTFTKHHLEKYSFSSTIHIILKANTVFSKRTEKASISCIQLPLPFGDAIIFPAQLPRPNCVFTRRTINQLRTGLPAHYTDLLQLASRCIVRRLLIVILVIIRLAEIPVCAAYHVEVYDSFIKHFIPCYCPSFCHARRNFNMDRPAREVSYRGFSLIFLYRRKKDAGMRDNRCGVIWMLTCSMGKQGSYDILYIEAVGL